MYADPISSSLIDDSSRAFDSIRSFTIFLFDRSTEHKYVTTFLKQASKLLAEMSKQTQIRRLATPDMIIRRNEKLNVSGHSPWSWTMSC